jgi:puromycin-sensitive aminopeptidase
MYDQNFRLPSDVRPVRYEARLTLDPATATFVGQLAIELTLHRPRRHLDLHGVDLQIRGARLRTTGRTIEAAALPEPAAEVLTFALSAEAHPGPAVLEIEYRGRFCAGLRGLYLAGPVAVTQFEAADARRAFPCFDEPAFKARWALTLDVPADQQAIANGALVTEEPLPRGRRLVVFGETPPISSYLVALVVGRLAATTTRDVRNVPCRTWATPEKVALCDYPQDVIEATLPLLVDYFDVPYAFGKLDQIGIPDFEAGAMENVGAITFREVALLCDPKTAPLAVQKRIAEVITHEAAHQWFGNLVTMEWWDDLWLNEAFATWMAYKIVDQWRPEWRMWIEWDRGKAGALALDALLSTHPIHTEVKNAAQAGENFDQITYDKGGAVLRMIEGYLGDEVFREGIRRYIRRHSYANAKADDLWRALAEASGQPVGELARSWIHQPGYPLVTTTVAGRRLTLQQHRYYFDPELLRHQGDARWLVPLVVRYGDSDGEHEQRVLLTERRTEVELAGSGPIEWLCGNAGGRGFWRVGYDAAGLRALSRHLHALDANERRSLIADQWALLRVGGAEAAEVLDLYARFGGETDHAVLEELGGRLAEVEQRLAGPATRPLLARFVGELLGPQLEEVGWDAAAGEPDPTRLRRAALVSALGLVARAPHVVAEAGRRFDRFLADPSAVEPNLVDAVVLMAARAGDATRFARILERIPGETDPTSRRRLIMALGAFEDPGLTERVVGLFLEDTVPLQEMAFYLMRVLDNRTAREAMWTLLRDRWDAVAARAGSPQIVRRFVKVLTALPERRHLEEVRAFLASHVIEGVEQTAAQTLERLRLDVDFAERVTPALEAWLRPTTRGTNPA